MGAATKSVVSQNSLATTMLVALMITLVANHQVVAQGSNCTSTISNLNVCAPYVLPGVPNNNPSSDCCAALQGVDRDCYCRTLRIAAQIPVQCNLPPLACPVMEDTSREACVTVMEDTSREAFMAVLSISSYKSLQVDNQTLKDMEKVRHEAIHKRLITFHPLLPPVASVTYRIEYCSKPLIKELEDSDVKENQSRLSLRKEFVKNEFLSILNGDENVKDGIEVTTYDSNGVEYESMVFKLWGDKMYVLTRQWKQFCEDHKLIPKDTVNVWMFRDRNTGKLSVVIEPKLLDINIEERETRRHILNGKISGSNGKISRK